VAVSTSYPIGWPFPDKDPTRWGNKVHQLLAKVIFAEDAEGVLKSALHTGVIYHEELPVLDQRLKEMFSHPELRPLFAKDAVVINEREVLSPEGKVKRPDRLVVRDEEWIVVDYKTGAEDEQHRKQVDEYAALLGSVQVKKMLVYLNEELKVLSWN
jgi:ATP-dependent exoDNAse (exonuclease V) beta subunit